MGKIFNSQVLDFDDRIVFINKEMGNRIFLRKKNYDGIDLRLIDRKNLSSIVLKIKNDFKYLELLNKARQEAELNLSPN